MPLRLCDVVNWDFDLASIATSTSIVPRASKVAEPFTLYTSLALLHSHALVHGRIERQVDIVTTVCEWTRSIDSSAVSSSQRFRCSTDRAFPESLISLSSSCYPSPSSRHSTKSTTVSPLGSFATLEHAQHSIKFYLFHGEIFHYPDNRQRDLIIEFGTRELIQMHCSIAFT